MATPHLHKDAALETGKNMLQGTEFSRNALQRVSYKHDAMIDMIIAHPYITQKELAEHFQVSEIWIGRVKNSDAFLARLAARKAEMIDPMITASVEEKFRMVADRALEVVMDKLSLPSAAVQSEFALKSLKIAGDALGYGARQQNLNVQQNFVVALPPKAQSTEAWAAAHAPQGQVIDAEAE